MSRFFPNQKIFSRSGRNPYRKARRHLTLLFTFAAGLILIIMSFLHLHTSESDLKKNYWLSFLSESNTILSNFEARDTITYTWLADISSHSNYFLAVYDNGSPLLHNQSHLTDAKQHAAEEVLSEALPLLSESSSGNVEFSCEASDKILYYINAARYGDSSSPLYVLVLFSTESLYHQLFRQRMLFLTLNICGIFFLFLFSWYFTGKLLLPVKESQKRQASFIAAASHELRTPLAVILSAADGLRTMGQTSDKQTSEQLQTAGQTGDNTSSEPDYLSIIENESSRMSTLVNDLLLLTRADHHSWQMHFEDTELDTLLLESYDSFYSLAKNASITLSADLPEEALPPCLCDKERISQVLAVLISNAISYGKRDGHIKLSLSRDSSCFEIKVEDDGPGIPDEQKSRIFEHFYRADPARSKKEHFGLGLSIAKEIVSAHRGSIDVNDTSGGGSTFTVKLPG